MKLLLDTHSFIFYVDRPDALPSAARAAMEDSSNELFLSLVSPWEMQIKSTLGKLQLGKPAAELVQAELDRAAIQLLPITLHHIDALSRLPNHHRDPFDRLLVAQAIYEGLTIVSSDQAIARYGAPVLWE
ncbi:MAG: type II toxin-antitoxin system VapC family toxin [Candidatus Hydrogenedentes bacterium]|nr:type II toxin-antitoxin system VapC family toxin [Candidatus Hydrogenedentota bacterium]